MLRQQQPPDAVSDRRDMLRKAFEAPSRAKSLDELRAHDRVSPKASWRSSRLSGLTARMGPMPAGCSAGCALRIMPGSDAN